MNTTRACPTVRTLQPLWGHGSGLRGLCLATLRPGLLGLLGLLVPLGLPGPALAQSAATVGQTARATQLADETARNTIRDTARDEFLRTHRWNDQRDNWRVLRVAPRNVDAMSITQMQTEVSLLRQTHRWDGSAGQWLARGNRPVPR